MPTPKLKSPAGPVISIQIRSPLWRRLLPDIRKRAREAAIAALAGARAGTRAGGLSLLFADDAAIRDLNRMWRGQDKPTNVLSFPAPANQPGAEFMRPLGDVILAAETVIREAEAGGKSLAHHMSHLVVHGVLHLLGYDHETAKDAALMEPLETRVLAGLGIADPYGDVR